MTEGDSVACLLAHFKEQVPLYGEQVIVNLVDQKKAEGRMEVNFKNIVGEAGLRGVHYVAFDFHTEVKGMHYERLAKLVRELKRYQDEFEYFFLADGDPSTLKRQRGVFRTNCMDCLDRTNVVQSLLATENLKLILVRMGIVKPTQDLLKCDAFQVSFSSSSRFVYVRNGLSSDLFCLFVSFLQNTYRNVWADHADLISIQYAGTGALKTDFTRTGKRTYVGMIQDGWNAINRLGDQEGDRRTSSRGQLN